MTEKLERPGKINGLVFWMTLAGVVAAMMFQKSSICFLVAELPKPENQTRVLSVGRRLKAMGLEEEADRDGVVVGTEEADGNVGGVGGEAVIGGLDEGSSLSFFSMSMTRQ